MAHRNPALLAHCLVHGGDGVGSPAPGKARHCEGSGESALAETLASSFSRVCSFSVLLKVPKVFPSFHGADAAGEKAQAFLDHMVSPLLPALAGR